MGKEVREILTEILKKEKERYKLDKIGFFRDIPTEADYILSHVDCGNFTMENVEAYSSWRESVLRAFYADKHFSSFIRSHTGEAAFQKMIRELFLSILEYRFTHEQRTEIDRCLAPAGKTLAYLLNEEAYETLYQNYFHSSLRIDSTLELNRYCFGILRERFPLTMEEVIRYLKQDDKKGWENLCARLKTLTESVTKSVIGSYRDDAIHDMWTETCFELRKAILNEKLQGNVEPCGLISYAAGIIRNKIREFFRKQKKEPYLFIEDWERDLSFKDSQWYCHEFKEDSVMKDFLDLKDIDIDDDYEFRMALSCVLYDREHPYHRQLIQGLEDKVDILLAHYVRNQSYEEIAFEKYGPLPEKEMKKKTDKLRQDVSRVKIKIKERFKEILAANRL